MAKNFNQIFIDSKETQYGNGNLPLLGMGVANNKVKFTPLVSPHTGGTQYEIQRAKRIKASNASTDASNSTRINANIDTLKSLDWETITVAPGVEKIIGMSIRPNIKFDFDSVGAAEERTLSARLTNTMIQMEEDAITTITSAVTPTLVSGTTDDEIIAEIDSAASNIKLFVDDYKAYSQNVVVLVHPTVGKMFADKHGIQYSKGTDTFGEGAGKSFIYNGVKYIDAPLLNAFSYDTDTNILGVIVMDAEAYADKGFTYLPEANFDNTLIGERYVGTKFNSVGSVVDVNRIVTLKLPKVLSTSAKVNA